MIRKMFVIVMLLPVIAMGQEKEAVVKRTKIGLKAGLNFANITKASSINADSRTGFMAGVFLAVPSHGIIGYRSELIYSRQGYDYKTGSTSGAVDLHYILLPQLMTINITKFVQLQAGGHMAFLAGGKVDSSKSTGTLPAAGKKMMDYYNRFDYGAAGGVEVYPFKGLLVGARYNISLGNLYKDGLGTTTPAFIPKVDVKNNVLQLFVGYKF